MEAYLYVISCKDGRIKDRYLGYTTNWEKCVEYHSDDYDRGRNANTKLYTFVREHGGWVNWDMTIIETYDSREEAEIAKMGLLESYNFELNSGKR
jgi:predicted GIY-YIG superfamily endonuclease